VDQALETWAENEWSKVENKRYRWLNSHWPDEMAGIKMEIKLTWTKTWKETWRASWNEAWVESWMDAWSSGCNADAHDCNLEGVWLTLGGQGSYLEGVRKMISNFKALNQLDLALRDSKPDVHKCFKVTLHEVSVFFEL
jgi:hypothetical protein